jgi:hypothetical protein
VTETEVGPAVTVSPLPAAPWRLDDPPRGLAGSNAVAVLTHWVGDYLSLPNAELGRRGPVCPYVPAARRRGDLFATLWPGRPARRELTDGLRGYRDWFAARSTRGLAALLVVFPAVTQEDVGWAIDGVQRALKSEFVEQGLMIGEFHPGPPRAAGLHNARFRPLGCPLPLLAIRPMVSADLPFLRSDPRHLAAHARRFGRFDA